eukprot:Rhum_TRINITY_DN2107_c0_g1::Rhum_TRINITY_DN2107_c0_g1_i1::g.5951::m.5951
MSDDWRSHGSFGRSSRGTVSIEPGGMEEGRYHGGSSSRRSYGRTVADERDEIIAVLTEKVRETSSLFEGLESRLLARERSLDDTRRDLADCENALGKAEAEIDRLRSRGGSGRRDYGAEAETGSMVRALQDELAEKERTGRLMKDMLDQKTSNINLLKVHHQTELDSQGGIFNSVLDKRESDLQAMGRQVESLQEQLTLLRVEHERLIEDTCIIFSLETARSDTELLDSLRTVQQYIDDRDADLAQLVKENEALQSEMSTHGANSDDIRDLREALKQTDDEKKELRIELTREIHELRAENEKLYQKAQEAGSDISNANNGSVVSDRVADAVVAIREVLIRHGVVVRDLPVGGQLELICNVVADLADELEALRRSRDKSRRQKEEVIAVVLEDPEVHALGWESESEPDNDDLSDHPSGNVRWACSRVRLRSVVDRLMRREDEVARLRDACVSLREECSTLEQSTGPYLGLVTESSRAADDTGPGVRLIEVRRKSAAEKAGLRQGDRLLEVGGRPVACAYDLDKALAGLSPGDTVDVTYLRGKATQCSTLTVDPQRYRQRRRHKKMSRSEIQSRVGGSP